MAGEGWGKEGAIIEPPHCCNKCNVQYTDCVKRINFDLQQLQAFVAVADKGSFRAAAEDMHLSAPALRQLREITTNFSGAKYYGRRAAPG